MTVDYHKHNQVVSPIADTIRDMMLLLEKINIAMNTWDVSIHLLNMFCLFFYPYLREDKKQFTFTWNGQQYILYANPRGLLLTLSPSVLTQSKR